MLNRDQAIAMLKALAVAILDTVREAGDQGAPASSLYLALATQGMSLLVFQQIMSGLVAAGKLRHSDNLYFAV